LTHLAQREPGNRCFGCRLHPSRMELVASTWKKPKDGAHWALETRKMGPLPLERQEASMKATLPRYARQRLSSATKQVLHVVKDSVYGMTSSEKIQYQLQQEILSLKQSIALDCPDNPALSGFKVYSQVDEDGIIHELFRRVPNQKLDHTLIEIGCGNGLENNTHFLMLQGYRGFWVDGSDRNIAYLNTALGLVDGTSTRLKVVHRFMHTENTADTITQACSFIGSQEPDIFSLDYRWERALHP
jgi:hypothetical protein